MTVLGRQEGHGKGGQGAQHLDGALNGKGKESCTMEKGGVSGREATVMTEHGPREEGLALGNETLWTTTVPPPRPQRPGLDTHFSPWRLQRECQSAGDRRTPAVLVLFAEIG